MTYLLLSFLIWVVLGTAAAQVCDTSAIRTVPGRAIGTFCSLAPTGQSGRLELPDDYRFQLLFQEGMLYTDGSGVVPGRHDFAGFVAENGSSERGHLSINHETWPGAVSVLTVRYEREQKLWLVDTSRSVDFAEVGGTGGNCSGAITPWGTVLTAEEKYADADANDDGYSDLGWLVEIHPVAGSLVGGDKCWALGHFKHENATLLDDERTVYFGEDGRTSGIYKFIADRPRDLSSGRLFGLVLDAPLVDREPVVPTGRWVLIPNETIAERNATSRLAPGLGVTNFDGVEDVEHHPVTGQVYFASKGAGRVYRFTDAGDHIRDLSTYVGGRDYTVSTPAGSYLVPWGTGNDNLVFDGAGNLWVMQDGDEHYIWVVRPEHSQAEPLVDIFARIPHEAEPTGLTFTPDFTFGFFSIQHPGSANEMQRDAAGNAVRFTSSATVVFALADHLGPDTLQPSDAGPAMPDVQVFPNPSAGIIYLDFGLTEAGSNYELELYDPLGRRLSLRRAHLYVPAGGEPQPVDLRTAVAGHQFVLLRIRQGEVSLVRKIWLRR